VALVLLHMAAGGVFVLRGKTGLAGRGQSLVSRGALVPIGPSPERG
jgi:hypothetical protein